MENLLKNWSVMRIVRLLAGVVIIWSSFTDRQPILGVLGAFLLLQAVLNTGCGSAGCSVPNSRKSLRQDSGKVHYEDI